MKKLISLLLVFTLTIASSAFVYADTNSKELGYQNLINQISTQLVIDNNGHIDVYSTLSRINDKAYSDEEIQKVKLFLEDFNIGLAKSNAYIDGKGIVRTIGSIPKKNLKHEQFYSLKGSSNLIEAGMYDIGNNNRRIYFDADDTQEMIDNRAKLSETTFWAGLAAAYFLPASVILGLASYVSDSEHDTFVEEFNESDENGIYCEFWRYTSSDRTWGPWYEGATVGSGWSKVD